MKLTDDEKRSELLDHDWRRARRMRRAGIGCAVLMAAVALLGLAVLISVL